ncbi:MAG: NAD(P)-dependent oxidoreductase [Deltaproteobacteria bacterium]|nr:NAD(P)-dependent oxidoreductase [Deltaproteobacteria bacterium]
MSDAPSTSLAGAGALRGQRVLVTGATGLVGQTLTRALVAAGAHVLALVREGSSGLVLNAAPPSSSAGTVERVVVPSYQPGQVRDALRGVRAELVFHLGAYGVKPTEQDPLALVEGNVGVTVAWLEALAAAPPRRFLFAGSSAQYAPRSSPTLLVEDSPQAPATLYGACKAAAEDVGRVLAARHGIPFVSMRLFGVYGPGESPHRMIPYLARALSCGAPPELTPGGQARDWVYVDDVAEALVLAAAAPRLARAWNVCSGHGTTVREVALAVGAALGKDEAALGLGRRDYRHDEPMWIVGSPALLQADTGFRARTPLVEGVRRTIAWAVDAAAGGSS